MRPDAVPAGVPVNAVQRFLASVARFPDRPALWVDGRSLCYRELHDHAQALAEELRRHPGTVCATLGERSLTAYCAPLACMLAGRVHVPLGASFPDARMHDILQRTRPAVLVCDRANEPRARALCTALGFPVEVVVPADDAPPAARSMAATASTPIPDPPAACDDTATSGLPVADSGIAYVLFTSGSTGRPKGVAVGHQALDAYVAAVLARYPQYDEQQRCSQFFEPTFDLSMHDMFVTWAAGACLYSVPANALMMPTAFVNEHRLSVWFSVPSLPATLQRLRLLAPGTLPTVRLALFCGEALPGAVVGDFMRAAPDARCDNLYGPTEATIACTAHTITQHDALQRVVPIGVPFPGMELAIVDAEGAQCGQGEPGELWLGGDQLAFGYWQDRDQTHARFVEALLPDRHATRWYRTGDLASIDARGVAHFHGRIDRQVKLRGYRVELQEVEAQLREACAATGQPAQVAVVTLADASGTLTGLAAFVASEGFERAPALAAMRRRLPAYMMPGTLQVLDALPLNSNGKVDYPALQARARADALRPRRHGAAPSGTPQEDRGSRHRTNDDRTSEEQPG